MKELYQAMIIFLIFWFYAGLLGMFEILMQQLRKYKSSKKQIIIILLSFLGGFYIFYKAFKNNKGDK